jgi:tripartite-type tricarboxylate transporter receptor subunit TctC
MAAQKQRVNQHFCIGDAMKTFRILWSNLKVSRPGVRRRFILWVLAVVTSAAPLGSSMAADPFPSAPIKLIVPYPPGGATDTIGRQLAIEASKALGQPVVVENKPGAAGNLGVIATINAAADGYTVVLAGSNNVAADPLQEKMPFTPMRDLVPVAPVVAIPYVVVANPGFAPNTIRELIAAAKAEPGKINFASSGTGAPPHFASELIKAQAGLDMQHVPYKGAVPAFTDVVGGQVQFMTGDINTAMPFLQSGRLKALATTGKERLELLPNVPTVAESGLPGYESEGWFGVFASAKTPPDIVAALSRGFVKATQEADFKKRMGVLGGRVLAMSKTDFDQYIASETTKRSNLIKANKIVLDN